MPKDHRPAPRRGRAAAVGRRLGRRLVGRAAAAVGSRVAAVALAGALVATGLGEVAERRGDAALAAAAADAVRAQRAEVARRDRVASADAARLTGGAVRYAALRRAEALDAAQAAVDAADTLVVSRSASPDVPAEALAPLGAATDALVTLIETTPRAVVVRSPAAITVPSPPAGGPVPTASTPAPATVAEPGPPAADPGSSAATTPVVPAIPAIPAIVVTPVAPVTTATSAGAATDDPAPVPAEPGELLRALDLAVSSEVLAAARRVTDLSVEARVAADAAVAAADAEREAARLARAEAAALAGRVAATAGAPNGRIPADLLCTVDVAPGALLRCDAARALHALAAAYRADTGRDLEVVSSYRSLDAQVAVKASRGALAAAPGRSNHGHAIAVDFAGFGGVGEFTAPAYLWMQQHAGRFGWRHPTAMEPGGSGPQEPWHWEFGTDG